MPAPSKSDRARRRPRQPFGTTSSSDAVTEKVLYGILDRIVGGQERIVTVGPELEHLHARRPADTKFAWKRMGVPVRCKTSQDTEITMWPWWDLDQNREHVELFIVTLMDGSTFLVSPEIRAHYRDKIKSGFF